MTVLCFYQSCALSRLFIIFISGLFFELECKNMIAAKMAWPFVRILSDHFWCICTNSSSATRVCFSNMNAHVATSRNRKFSVIINSTRNRQSVH